jgi:hypothetical protein
MAARTARLSRRPPCSKASCSPPSPNPSSVAHHRPCGGHAAHQQRTAAFARWTSPSSGVGRSVRTTSGRDGRRRPALLLLTEASVTRSFRRYDRPGSVCIGMPRAWPRASSPSYAGAGAVGSTMISPNCRSWSECEVSQPGSPWAAKSGCPAGATGVPVSEADVAAAEVAAADVAAADVASGIPARVAHLPPHHRHPRRRPLRRRTPRTATGRPGSRRRPPRSCRAGCRPCRRACPRRHRRLALPCRAGSSPAGGHPGEGAGVVASGALVFGHGRAQVAQRRAPLLGRQLGEGFLMGLLDRCRRGGPHKVAVALERLLVCEFARGGRRGRRSVLLGP